ncbi:MAG: hypothetical protein MAG794_00034 [Gammaproteobacteria bacterium]|nr:hypothetical protein [Gammaproteobacteria bacterium]
MYLTGLALDPGQPVQVLPQRRAQLVDVDVGPGQQMPDAPSFLIQQRHHHVRRLDVLLVAADRQALCIRQRHLELGGKFIHPHGILSANSKLLIQIWGKARGFQDNGLSCQAGRYELSQRIIPIQPVELASSQKVRATLAIVWRWGCREITSTQYNCRRRRKNRDSRDTRPG